MAQAYRLSQLIALIKAAVEAGGGEWVGYQTSISPDIPDQIVFNNPSGNMLTLPYSGLAQMDADYGMSKITEAVRRQIEGMNKPFADRKISVKAVALQKVHDNLLNAVKDIEEMLVRKP